MPVKDYEKNVFINCPFDDQFEGIFYAKVFCIFSCGFRPRCSREYEDSSEIRIEKIAAIISQCKYGLHDISYRTTDCKKKFPRLNMPFELGLFMGAKKYGDEEQKKKICLITDIKKYDYQAFISDISGQDIRAHAGKPEQAINIVCDWLRNNSKVKGIPGGTKINNMYTRFKKDLPALCEEAEITMEEMCFNDYCNFAYPWVKDEKN